jgi:hypothetical protein
MAKAKELAALKKSDLLAALKDKDGENRTDLTKDSLLAELTKSFAFIPEYFNYLFAEYAGAGKFEILPADEEGNELLHIKTMGQVRTSPRTIYTISTVLTEVEYEDETTGEEMVVSCEKSTLMPGDKLPEGSSLSKVSAVKAAKKTAYATYKASLEAMEAWLLEPEEESEEEEAA